MIALQRLNRRTKKYILFNFNGNLKLRKASSFTLSFTKPTPINMLGFISCFEKKKNKKKRNWVSVWMYGSFLSGGCLSIWLKCAFTHIDLSSVHIRHTRVKTTEINKNRKQIFLLFFFSPSKWNIFFFCTLPFSHIFPSFLPPLPPIRSNCLRLCVKRRFVGTSSSST